MIDPVEFGKQMGALIRESADELKAMIAAQAKEIAELREALAATETLDVAEVVSQVLVREELKTLVDLQTAESVTSYFNENPVQHGKDGTDGKDGVGLASAIIDREGELVLTNTKGDSFKLGKVIGSDGDKGKDGADFTSVEIDYDGERTLTIRGTGGEIVKTLPIPIDRGYWRDGLKAEKGDVYTEDGSAWIALKATDKKPSIGNSEDWRMMARKGRDGRQGDAGKDYQPPQPVKLNG